MEMDYSSSNLIHKRRQEMTITILMKFETFGHYYVSFCLYFFPFITLGSFFLLFQDNKKSIQKARGQTYEA